MNVSAARFTLPGRWAQVKGTLRKPKNMTSINVTDSETPKARWNSAAAGGKQANSMGASAANSGRMAQIAIHFRVAARYSAAQRAIDLDPDLADGHTSLAYVKL